MLGLGMEVGVDCKKAQENIWGDRNIPYFDCGCGYMGEYIFSTHQTIW